MFSRATSDDDDDHDDDRELTNIFECCSQRLLFGRYSAVYAKSSAI